MSGPDTSSEPTEATAPTAATQPTQAPEVSEAGADTEPADARYGRFRRAPRYGNFMLSGGVLGVVVGVILTLAQPTTGEFSSKTVIGYVAAILGLVGVVLGAFVAILVDQRRRRSNPR